MGYCGIKISGHSETDFKHRKAFVSRKKVLDLSSNSDKAVTTTRTYNFDFNQEKKLRFAGILISSFLVLALYLFTKSFFRAGITPHINKLKSHHEISNSDKIEAAYLLYNSAKSYYNSGKYNLAQTEMNKVLKLYPENSDAIQLMSQILNKQCVHKNLYCKEADQYRAYIKLHLF